MKYRLSIESVRVGDTIADNPQQDCTYRYVDYLLLERTGGEVYEYYKAVRLDSVHAPVNIPPFDVVEVWKVMTSRKAMECEL